MIVYIYKALLGIVLIPLVPAVYEYAVEIVFPIGEASAIGYIIAMSSMSSSVFGIVFSVIVKGEKEL